MEKNEFISYTARRYGLDEQYAAELIDIFSSSIQDIIRSGQNLSIDEIGSFITTSFLDKKIVTFKPSDQLINA